MRGNDAESDFVAKGGAVTLASVYNRKAVLGACGLTDPGCVRRNNEDAYLVDSDLGLYLVADGMGGAQAGEHASRIAIDTVQEFIRSTPNGGMDTLVAAFESANRRVMAEAEGDVSLEGMGTTLVGFLERGDDGYVASVGDSRAYLYDEEDGLTPLTEDQTWVNEVGRRLGIDENNLKTHPMRHVLTMAIGVSAPLRVGHYRIRPVAGAQILLTSDGLHGVIGAEEISGILSSPISLDAKCHSLIEAARREGGPDNITAVLLQY